MTELGMLDVEMESAALYVVARQRGLRAGMVCSVSSNLVEGASVYDAHDRLAAGWHHSIEVALAPPSPSACDRSGDRPQPALPPRGLVPASTAEALAHELDLPAPPGGWEAALVMAEGRRSRRSSRTWPTAIRCSPRPCRAAHRRRGGRGRG